MWAISSIEPWNLSDPVGGAPPETEVTATVPVLPTLTSLPSYVDY